MLKHVFKSKKKGVFKIFLPRSYRKNKLRTEEYTIASYELSNKLILVI